MRRRLLASPHTRRRSALPEPGPGPSPSPSPTARRRRPGRLGVTVAVAGGLVLGFLAGIELARAGRALQPPRSRPQAARPPVVASAPVDLDSSRPTRRSVHADVEATDPGAWLARFGEVEIRSLHEVPFGEVEARPLDAARFDDMEARPLHTAH